MVDTSTFSVLYTSKGYVGDTKAILVNKGRVIVSPWPTAIHITTPFAVRAQAPDGATEPAWIRALDVRLFIFDNHGRDQEPGSIGVVMLATGSPYVSGPVLTPIPPAAFEAAFEQTATPAQVLVHLAPDIFTAGPGVSQANSVPLTDAARQKLSIPQYSTVGGDHHEVVDGICRWLGWD